MTIATGEVAMTPGGHTPAADAADRLILDEAAGAIPGARVVAIGSAELATGARDLGAADVRSFADSKPGSELGAELLVGATVVLVRLPKSLDALDRIARQVALHADPTVVVFAGGRLKYMTRGMNDVLARSFGQLDVSLARQKSRVLISRTPLEVELQAPRRTWQPDLELWVGAVGGVFAGSSLDIGTRAMLAAWGKLPDYAVAVDLGCGSGILAAELKRRSPGARVIASDVSADAVESARETMLANELDVEVVRDTALSLQPSDSLDLVVLNPPFHDEGAVTTDIAIALFADAARALKPGGQLWAVWNSHLAYRPELTRLVGPTIEVSRTPKFTITASTKGPA
jgi:16S rRNA (guanine1207-N2)-methyltransferase